MSTARFQLTKDEYENLKSQIATSSLDGENAVHGGRRKLPYTFTERGVPRLFLELDKYR